MLPIVVLAFAFNIIFVVGEICPTQDLDFCEVVALNADSPIANQLEIFRDNTTEIIGKLTTLVGKPIEANAFDNFIKTPLTSDLLERILHFNREVIFPRIVHAKGGGAFGKFTVTNDVSAILGSIDTFLGVGKVTPVAVRFSPTKNDFGGQDTIRDARGFAVKFFTHTEGIFDLLMLSVPLFSIKDAIKFPAFTKAQKRNPQTNRPDPNTLIDLIVQNEEIFNFILRVFGDLGIPCSYQNMAGWAIHTFAACDKYGNTRYVRFRLTPDAGIKGLSSEDAVLKAGQSYDYFNNLLYNAIAEGDYPTWTLAVQSLTQKDVDNADINVIDITFELDKYPFIEIGKLTLNRNQENYFRDIEQMTFCIANLPRGLQGVPGDKVLEIRSFIYQDAQDHRVGVNHDKIVVNSPTTQTLTYQRDGVSPVGLNGGNSPNYLPNSFNGPIPVATPKCPKLNFTVYINPEADNFKQASDYFKKLSIDEQKRLVTNIANELALVTAQDLVDKFLKLTNKVDRELGAAVKAALTGLQKTCPLPPRPLNKGATIKSTTKIDALLDRLRTYFGLA